jgi:hypothetical protein
MARRFALVCLIGLFEAAVAAQSNESALRNPAGPGAPELLQFTVSRPVREMPPQSFTPGPPKEIPLRRPFVRSMAVNVADPVVQTSAPVATAQSVGQFEGLGAGYLGFSVTAVPPDPNIAVGPNHIVQWVNNGFVVFDKQGQQVQAPVGDGTFWGSSTCDQLGGFSDPIVQYDAMADRWLIGEVAIPLFPGLIGQFAQCFAVSTTPDPTGSYYMWAYGFGSNIDDYPKIGVWPDAYYVTWNIFSGAGSFLGPEACAFDRSDMVGGASAPAFVCFKPSSGFASLLPSDLDGSTPPPPGSPNFLMNIDPASSALYLWKFHADFANTKNSTFTGPIAIGAVAPFTAPCLTTQDCIPQPGTTERLDALGDRLLYRLAYRQFGDHASLVANHTVVAPDGNTAVRWYEVRNPDGTPTIYQQGTFAPDTDNRWMASVAMDRSGNIGVGYSVASSVTYPSIRFTGWEVGNPIGVLQAETFAVVGGGSQTGYNRWGDYSAMRIDPADDCTFWYTQEYEATTQSASWNTRIASFRFASCGGALTPTTTALAASPNPSNDGQSVTFTATVSPAAATGTVTFFDGVNAVGTATLGGGLASLSTATLSVGSHSVTAVYGGDSSYGASTSPIVTQTVVGTSIGTATSLVSTPNPSTYRQAVVLLAGVTPLSGSSTPTGSVTFVDGAIVLGMSALDANGFATLTTSSLAVGTHSIAAQYQGDSTHGGSSSAAVSQTVNKADTATTLTANRNPSNGGQPVTFKAAVSPSTATGTVHFFDGSVLLGTAPLSNGTATLTTSSLSAGSHAITAQYDGDANDNGSASAVLIEIVGRKK